MVAKKRGKVKNVNCHYIMPFNECYTVLSLQEVYLLGEEFTWLVVSLIGDCYVPYSNLEVREPNPR